MRRSAFGARRHFERDNELSAFEYVVPFRRVTRKPMKVGEGYCAITGFVAHMNDGIERRKRHGEIGRGGAPPRLGPAEDRGAAIEPMQRRAAGSRRSLVARKTVVIPKVRAAR